MVRQFTLADIANWPSHERRIFVLEHVIQAQEDDLAKAEALCRAEPDSALHPSRAADVRVLIHELREMLDEVHAPSKTERL